MSLKYMVYYKVFTTAWRIFFNFGRMHFSAYFESQPKLWLWQVVHVIRIMLHLPYEKCQYKVYVK